MVEALEKTNGRVSAVLLTGGERIAADMVIVGIGLIPEPAPLLAAGASVGNGVAVAAFCRTTLPAVYAVVVCSAPAAEMCVVLGNIVSVRLDIGVLRLLTK